MTPPAGAPFAPSDQTARERILRDLDATLLIEAGAGTGKTTSLVGRMVELVATGRCRAGGLVAVTFTRKAAAELRSRFTAALERAAPGADGERAGRLAEGLAHAERCFIGTIHSFCARLLRERPVEAGVDLAFEEIDEDADAQLRARAWREFCDRLFERGDPRLPRLKELGLELRHLEEAFQTFAAYPDVERWPAPEPELGDLGAARAALLEYAGQMRCLSEDFPQQRGNDKLMGRYERVARRCRFPDVLARPAELMAALAEFDCEHGAVQKCWPGGSRGVAKSEIERWTSFRDRYARPLLARWKETRYAAVLPLLRSAVEVYDELRAEARVLNFQDLLLRAARLLRERPAVRRYFRERVTHLLVDEFQDTDPLQAEVVLLLTADDPGQSDWRACRPVAGSLCVVGDPKQSIYRFRRADIATYQAVKGIIVAAGGAVVGLDASFRTLPELVAWTNAVFAPPGGFPERDSAYSPAARPLASARAAAPAALAARGVCTLTVPEELSTNEACAAYDAARIARTIRRALDGRLALPRTAREVAAGVAPEAVPGDFLIVAWRKDRLPVYAAALQQLGIPHQVSGGSAWGQVAELGLLAALLRALVEPENAVALTGVLRGELFGFSDADLYDLVRAGGQLRFALDPPAGMDAQLRERLADAYGLLRRCAGKLRALPPVAALERIAADTGLALRTLVSPGADGRAGTLAKAFAVLRAQAAEPGSAVGLADLLERLIEDAAPFDGLPARAAAASAVRVMNLHKAKGLEAPVVFLADPGGKPRAGARLHVDRAAGAPAGYLRVESARGRRIAPLLAQPPGWEERAAEEERFLAAERQRLLYVAATRAGTQLVVSRRAGKRKGDSPWEQLSPWLADAPELPEPEASSPPVVASVALEAADEDAALAAIAARWAVTQAPSYAVRGAKEVALDAAQLHRMPRAGEHGTEWGTVIHFLLETALRVPGRDLGAVAAAALEEQGLPAARAAEALALVASVRSSDLWRRAEASGRRLVEAPLAVWLPPGDPLLPDAPLPTLVRGVVDLAFREAAGWVLVDWKTDAAATPAEVAAVVRRYERQVRLYGALWERVAGEPVAETGLFLAAASSYERV